MKKLFFLVLTVLMIACSSDDDNTCNVLDTSLAGTWVSTNDMMIRVLILLH
tara:strand:+ start:22072 stop:22224 length:153 start_codon:yes stop_codon:yes gene_type:complete